MPNDTAAVEETDLIETEVDMEFHKNYLGRDNNGVYEIQENGCTRIRYCSCDDRHPSC
jgi:hypothetical protein